MSDLKERLRAGCPSGCGSMTECACATMADALAYIQKLERENAEQRLTIRAVCHAALTAVGHDMTVWLKPYRKIERDQLGVDHK